MRRKIVLNTIIVLIVLSFLCGCGNASTTYKGADANSTRTIIDRSGNEITIPNNIENYAVAWAGLTDILLMFDGTEHLVAYPEKSASFKWIFDVYPEYGNKVELSNEGISAEELIETGAQVVFLKAADDETLYTKLNECGVAAIDCKFDTYEELQEVVLMIADIINTDDAKIIANEYVAYLNDSVESTVNITKTISDADKVSALVLKDTKSYSAYGSSRYTGKWVEMCGGKYSMVNEDTYANVNLTSEQIIEYDPQFIFFAMPKQADKFLEDDVWDNLDAVKNARVINIPGGFNTWSNCGAESALVFKWATAVMYPDKVDYDIKSIITEYYDKFYGYSPNEHEIDCILSSSF